VVGNGRLDPKNLPRNELISQYFNAAAFALPATGLSGNSGRNNLVGPGFFNADVAMQKDSGRRSPKSRGIRIPRRGVQHVNFVNLGNPNRGMNSTVFGKINSSRDARIFQFGLRYDF